MQYWFYFYIILKTRQKPISVFTEKCTYSTSDNPVSTLLLMSENPASSLLFNFTKEDLNEKIVNLNFSIIRLWRNKCNFLNFKSSDMS